MPLRLYANECVDARIVAGVRRRSIEVVTAADEGLLGSSDEAQFERAEALGRVIVSSDQDFLRLAHARAEAGDEHPGLLFILPQTAIGDAVRRITLVSQAKEPADLKGWVEWI